MSASSDAQNRCPYLGLANDPDSYYGSATYDNLCHCPKTPQPIALTYQVDVCMTGDHVNCVVFQQEEWRGRLPDDIKPDWARGVTPTRRWTAISVAVLLPLTIGLVLIGIVGRNSGLLASFLQRPQSDRVESREDTPGPESTPDGAAMLSTDTPFPTLRPTITPFRTATPSYSPTPDSTLTLTPTHTRTTTPTPTGPTLTPTSTSTPAAYLPVITLAFGSNLRAGPGTDFDSIGFLEEGTQLQVLGRDLDGFWLSAHTQTGQEGWVAFSQVADAGEIDVDRIPLADVIPTLDVTPTPGE